MTHMILINGAEHHFQGGAALNDPAQSHGIETIAHSLAQINRFTGHCVRPYSVAEHSLLVAQFAANEGASASTQLAALMHDAHESIVGDLASPVKWAVGSPWADFEHHQAAQLHNHHGLRSAMNNRRTEIRRWDLIALATERRDLTAYNPAVNAPWQIIDNPAAPVAPDKSTDLKETWRQYREWHSWKEEFIFQYHRLRQAVLSDAAALMAVEGGAA